MTAPALDKINVAIAAAEAPVQHTMRAFDLMLHTGRPARLLVPIDATDSELLEIVANVSGVVHNMVAEARVPHARSRLLVPR